MVSTRNRSVTRFAWMMVGVMLFALVLVLAIGMATSLIGQRSFTAPPPADQPPALLTATQSTATPTAASATATATSTATVLATATPVAPTATSAPLYQQPAASTVLTGFDYIPQTWNNCGPATLAMQLSYFGSDLTQAAIGGALRTNADDKNVNPVELAEYARSQGYQALVRVNGSADLMRTLLANQIPVIIETWLEAHPGDGLGHYRLLVGYDDAQQHWVGYDSYYRENLINPSGDYAGIRMPYAETDQLWRVFNRTYVVVYTEAQAPLVESILGADFDDNAMWTRALATARAEVEQNPGDAFAWFNLGTALTALGQVDEAATAFDQAQAIGLPWRMFWYQFGPFHAYYAVGRHQDVIDLADSVLRPAVQIEELHDWKSRAYAALGNSAAANEAQARLAPLNSHYQPSYAEIPQAEVTTLTVAETPTPAPAVAATSVPSLPASTTQPTATATVAATDLATFVADVTIPDGTVMQPGESFTKTWRIRNDGDQAWEGYKLRPVDTEGVQTSLLGGPGEIAVPSTATGETIDISLLLTAPGATGTYTGYWQLVPPDGHRVSGGQLWTVIVVE